jgi:hypothetical protein
MKLFALSILAAWLFSFAPATTTIASNNADTTKYKAFTEGVLYTRVSFPGNIMNELLSKIDFEKGNILEQLKELQRATASKAYADKVSAQLKTMTAAEKASMGGMLMAAMMSPLYAKINYTEGQVLAKANALNYTMESYMNTRQGKGKMVVISNNKNQDAAIEFSAANMRSVWEKEEVDALKYDVNELAGQEMVAGNLCKKVVYTYKKDAAVSSSRLVKPAYKLTVWYAPQISADINFLHPFYFQLDKGILKIEVQYDTSGKNRMVYEVTRLEPKKLTTSDFAVTPVMPVVNWDTNQAQASMNMLAVMMSSSGTE